MSEIRLTDEQRMLVETNLRMVKSVVNRLRPAIRKSGMELDDAYSIGYVGLMHAATSYDSRRGASFQTYSYAVIRNELIKQMRKRIAYKRAGSNTDISINQEIRTCDGQVVTLDEFIADASPIGIDPAIQVERAELVRLALSLLSPYESDLLWRRFVWRYRPVELAPMYGKTARVISNDIYLAILKARAYLEMNGVYQRRTV